MYPAYVPAYLDALEKRSLFIFGFGYYLKHPERMMFNRVEQTLHEVAHAVLLWDDDALECLEGIERINTASIRAALSKRGDRCTQECKALAIELWILNHWGFSGTDDWLNGVVSHQPRRVSVRRVYHHLKHPKKRLVVVQQAHRVLRLIRESVKYWRNNAVPRSNQSA